MRMQTSENRSGRFEYAHLIVVSKRISIDPFFDHHGTVARENRRKSILHSLTQLTHGARDRFVFENPDFDGTSILIINTVCESPAFAFTKRGKDLDVRWRGPMFG